MIPDDGQEQQALCEAYADGQACSRGEREVRARGFAELMLGQPNNIEETHETSTTCTLPFGPTTFNVNFICYALIY